MIQSPFEIAKTHLDDALILLKKKRINSAASRAYYESYQAMRRSRSTERGKSVATLAIIKHFVTGYWFEPDHNLFNTL